MIWIYNVLLILLSPVWVPWMLWRASRRAEKVNWKERTGDVVINLPKGRPRIWFHAVSVGEVVAAMPILKAVKELKPQAQIVLSVTTSSGHQTAREKAVGLYDALIYFPIDVPRFCLASLVRVKPDVVAIMETELWMNFLWLAQNIKARTVLVNGRISDRHFPGCRRVKPYYKALFHSLDEVLVQSEVDRERFLSLGSANAEVLGNCKFDQAAQGLDADPAFWRKELDIPESAPVVVVGSTRGEAEERMVLEALLPLKATGLHVVHAPRHLERADALYQAAKEVWGAVGRRSTGEVGSYTILDTYGELAGVYGIADVVIVGGGFDDQGGQNIIQPLAHGKPVIHGPHMQNFRDSSEAAAHAGATLVASDSTGINEAVGRLLQDLPLREKMGAAAAGLVSQNLGASQRYAERIVGLL